ncbi:sulfite exporter TauE/SafE family protein [Pontibacillus sp. HMF3514]|uniref:sulfite exporter TauE/SafE family protein n=1 Tax=Pontibacillus sp. HMF3514 TaxID=2692425 RepID=UPI001F455F55|nr:sulfite exporter TauE/SafE family protein [Pontibacillus sp. HMF3514]
MQEFDRERKKKMSGFVSVLAMGLLLGIKHSLEPDHVVAVSTLASENKSLKKSSLAGVVWGVGHTLTIALVGMIVFLLNIEITESVSGFFEVTVGVMIIYLGIRGVLSVFRSKPRKVSLFSPAIIGFIHGLAGSAAMIVLIVATIDTTVEAVLYLLVFGVGTVTGMMLFTVILGLPFTKCNLQAKWMNTLTVGIGFLSILFGTYYITSIYY